MTYKVIFSDAARQDIRSALRYIRFTLQNKKAADDLRSKAKVITESLADLPERFQLVNDPILSSCGIRAVGINSYLAFYTVSEDGYVYIVRFLYSRRNWAKILASVITDQ